MKKKTKNVLISVVSLFLCAVLGFSSSTLVYAEESTSDESSDIEPVFYDTDQGRFVNDLDEYLIQLNNGAIEPFNSVIVCTEYENTGRVEGYSREISDPSQSCSNIFGHKWGNWGSWSEVSRIHYPQGGYCSAQMERWRFCTRTHCSAYQIETDYVWVQCSH